MVPLTVFMMAGISLGGQMAEWRTGLAVLAAVLLVTMCLRRHPFLQSLGIAVCTVLLGATLASRTMEHLDVEWPDGKVRAQLIVTGEPVVKERSVTVEAVTADGSRKIRCYIARDAASETVAVGQGLEVEARITKVREWHSGRFDYRRFMLCHGFAGEAYVGRGQWRQCVLPLDGLSALQRVRLKALLLRHRLLETFRQQALDEKVYGIVAAMALGEKSTVDKGLKDTYSQVGASHVLALSGLHLMIIYTFITLFTGRRRIRAASQVLIVLAIWAFAFLVGLSPSVTRAATMISLYALLSLGYRVRMSVNILAFVALVMLIVSPLSLYDLGFQLSFLGVLGILLFQPLLESLFPQSVPRRWWVRLPWAVVTVSTAAQIATAPLVAYQFGRFATWFLLSNFVAVTLMQLVLYLALAVLLVAWWPVAQTIMAKALALVVGAMNSMLGWIAGLPPGSVEGINLSGTQVVLVYALIACCYLLFFLPKSWRKVR